MVKLNTTVDIGELRIKGRISRDAVSEIGHEVPLAAGIAGTVDQPVDTVITMAEGHGFTTGDFVDLFWTDAAGELRVMYMNEVDAHDATTITINDGFGDDLPANGSSLIVGLRVEIESDFDGDLMKMLAIAGDRNSHVQFREEGGGFIHAKKITAGELFLWLSEQDVANPLAGNPVGKVTVSCGETQAGTLKIGLAYNT